MAATPSQELQVTRNGGRFCVWRVLLNQQQANTNGIWYDTLLMHPFSIVILGGPWVGDVTIYVSNGTPTVDTTGRVVLLLPPDNNDNQHPTLGMPIINVPYSAVSDGPYRYVKVGVANYVSGSISAGFAASTNVSDKA